MGPGLWQPGTGHRADSAFYFLSFIYYLAFPLETVNFWWMWFLRQTLYFGLEGPDGSDGIALCGRLCYCSKHPSSLHVEPFLLDRGLYLPALLNSSVAMRLALAQELWVNVMWDSKQKISGLPIWISFCHKLARSQAGCQGEAGLAEHCGRSETAGQQAQEISRWNLGSQRHSGLFWRTPQWKHLGPNQWK